jgi:lipopolysaccharide export LptBFGC system permease protein LptF
LYWGRVFIFSQQADQSVEIFTARSGKIDSSGPTSELVLSDVLATKFPPPDEPHKSYVVERSEQLRISINTGRADLFNKLNNRDPNTDAKDWSQLKEQATSAPTEKERREAERVLYRRVALSISPLVFAFLGGALGLRVRRGGRSMGIILSLAVVMIYYLTSLLGETLARVGTVPPILGVGFASMFMVGLSVFFLIAGRFDFSSIKQLFKRPVKESLKEKTLKSRTPYTLGVASWGFPNLLDATVFRSLALSFLVGFVALVGIFNIFTLFSCSGLSP